MMTGTTVDTRCEAYRAETERLRVLIEFAQRGVCAPGGAEPDPDVLTAYNLAVESVLQAIRVGSRERCVSGG